MKYPGSKARHGALLLGAMQDYAGDLSKYSCWVEPFAGCLNMTKHVRVPKYKIVSDSNVYLMEMFKQIQKGWTPPTAVSEAEYIAARNDSKKDVSSFSDIRRAEIGFIGVACSFGGKWFGGYARGVSSKGVPRNYAQESADNLSKRDFTDIDICSADYTTLTIPNNSLVYCDPPYAGTIGYKDKFDSEAFFKWAQTLSTKAIVFVSEYSAPRGWECILEVPRVISIARGTPYKKDIDKLFVYTKKGADEIPEEE